MFTGKQDTLDRKTGLPNSGLKTSGAAKFGQITRRREKAGLGFCFLAILVWIFVEYGRPPNPLKLPLIISSLLFVNWLFLPGKKWRPQIICFFLLIGKMLIDVPLADNTYAAFWTTYGMVVLLVYICTPLIHFVDSLRKVTILINFFLFVFLYIGVVAVFTGGMGPARQHGGQDENYTAALMCMAGPIAVFSIYFAKGFKKLLLIGAVGVYVIAVIVGFSRGGFIGMVVATLFCLVKSPKKWAAVSVGAVGLIAVLTLASAKYWRDMSTITSVEEGTANLRIEAWKIGIRMFLDNPIFGVGPNNFKWHMVAYQSPEQFEKFDRGLFLFSHSTYIDLLSELGLIGLSLFGAVLYYNYKDVKFMTKQLPKWREDLGEEIRGTPEEYRTFSDDCYRIRCYAYGLMGASLGLLAAFAFLSGLYYSNFWILTAMIVALKEVAIKRLEQYKKLPVISDRQERLRRAVSW